MSIVRLHFICINEYQHSGILSQFHLPDANTTEIINLLQ